MIALTLGLAAALAWGLHDFLVRYISLRTSVTATMFTVLLTGTVLVATISFALDESFFTSQSAFWYSAASGAVFALGYFALYKAYEIGPVRVVAPLIAAYPVLSVGWAAVSGTEVTIFQWVAVISVILGIGIVTTIKNKNEKKEVHTPAIVWSLISACSFAFSFTIGQQANLEGADFLVLTVIRISALLPVAVYSVLRRETVVPSLPVLPFLILMGCLDAIALGVVIAAAPFPNPEYAVVSSSTAGIVTIFLAHMWLHEEMTLGQWSGVLLSFLGIVYLAL